MITVDRRGHAVTVVAFSGIASRNHLFEWATSTRGLPANFIGVQDPHNAWYQIETETFVRKIHRALKKTRCSRIVCLGGSAGGYAALLFGGLFVADRIIAFCPQTVCGPLKRQLGDDRFPEYCLQTPHTSYSDLSGSTDQATIHYAEDDEMDVFHAGRVTCRKVAHKTGGHSLPKLLKATGELDTILYEAVTQW